jgi:GAF domain-containing protein
VIDSLPPDMLQPEDPLHRAIQVLDSIVNVALVGLPQLLAASVSAVGAGHQLQTLAASSPEASSVDDIQYESGGPCVEAMASGDEVRDHLPSVRWPSFSEAAVAAGFGSVWSLPVGLGDAPSACLNLYYESGDPWSESSSPLAKRLASQAGAVLANAKAFSQVEQLNSTLRKALETRTIIGQAQGVLMARQGIEADAAFDILRRASQRTNRKLRDIAAEIVEGVIHKGHEGIDHQ